MNSKEILMKILVLLEEQNILLKQINDYNKAAIQIMTNQLDGDNVILNEVFDK